MKCTDCTGKPCTVCGGPSELYTLLSPMRAWLPNLLKCDKHGFGFICWPCRDRVLTDRSSLYDLDAALAEGGEP